MMCSNTEMHFESTDVIVHLQHRLQAISTLNQQIQTRVAEDLSKHLAINNVLCLAINKPQFRSNCWLVSLP